MNGNRNIKKIIVYSLLYLYVFAQLKPLLPAVQDAVAHTFYKMEHLATVHYENGKYHLHAELKSEANEQNNSDKKNTAGSSYETVSIHEQSNEMKLLVFANETSEIIPHNVGETADVFLKAFIPPPET